MNYPKLLHNANFITLDDQYPDPEAVLIENGLIKFIGKMEEAKLKASDNIEMIDLHRKTVIPGFNDNHLHTIAMADYLAQPHLDGLDANQIIEVLKKEYDQIKPGEPIYGNLWDYTHCSNPHKSILDQHFPHNPVVLTQYSGHGIWVNSQVLNDLKISKDTPNPEGGKIERDQAGEPTGLLFDRAAHPITRKKFKRMHSKKSITKKHLEIALTHFAQNGITSVQDNTWYPITIKILNQYVEEKKLTCRFSCWSNDLVYPYYLFKRVTDFDKFWVREGIMKYFFDGTFSTRTAWLKQEYADDPANYGMPVMKTQQVEKALKKSLQQNRQIGFHAIGDQAVCEIINSIEKSLKEYPELRVKRPRIEHAQLVDYADIPRIKEAGILIAAQPSALNAYEKDQGLLGNQRADQAYPYRSLLDQGVHLSFGSDFPGDSILNPLQNIHQTVNRSGSEKITPKEALICYTQESAYAEFTESFKGTISPGKVADLTVLSDNLLTIEEDRINQIKVLATLVNGKTVFQSQFIFPD
ncbi:MAG: amidohydrolase [Spirochaetes bacterium]|nr:amidohydrolase [Spirochaetota bacterium]